MLDAVNDSETLDGTARSREVVVESGRYTKHEHLLFPISPACLRAPTRAPAFDDNERALYYRNRSRGSWLSRVPSSAG